MGRGIYGGELGVKEPGPIEILVGLEDKETIKGIYVVSNSETPLYWNRLFTKNYFAQFEGLSIENAYFVRDGGNVDVATGATVSSLLVLDTVRDAALEKAELI
jgi:electron transport complex protein RnfG